MALTTADKTDGKPQMFTSVEVIASSNRDMY
jgi:hypothetical protein